MTTEPKLEAYLSKLEKALGQIPVSDRAEIITEIKSHVLESQSRNPEQDLDTILTSLGEPEIVATRYLQERGLQSVKVSRSSPFMWVPMVIKWLVIGFLGFVGIIVLMVCLAIWKFTPLVKVDNVNHQVSIGGGLISVHDEDVSEFFHDDKTPEKAFIGNIVWDKTKYDQLNVQFSQGKLVLSPSRDDQVRWNCRYHVANGPAEATSNDKNYNLDFTKTGGAVCDIEVPVGTKTKLSGNSGKVIIKNPRDNTDVDLVNGKVEITPDMNTRYKYDLHVQNGSVDPFNSSNSSQDVTIHVNLVNGVIRRD